MVLPTSELYSGAPSSPQPSSGALPPGATLHPGPPRRLPGPGALSPAALPAPRARRTWAPRSLHSEHAAGGQQAEAQPQSQPSRRHVAGPGRRPPPRGGLPVRRRGCGGSGSGAGSAPHGGAVAPRSSGLGAVGGGRSGAAGFQGEQGGPGVFNGSGSLQGCGEGSLGEVCGWCRLSGG